MTLLPIGASHVPIRPFTFSNSVSPLLGWLVAVGSAALATDASSSELYLSTTGTVKVVTVTASVPYSGTGLWSYLGFGTLNITASHQERVIGW